MGLLEGRVAVITGAGRGLGRAHALLFAAEGAQLVINDFDGAGEPVSPAQKLVDEITGLGGEAIANTDDVSSWEGGRQVVKAAVDHYGDLDVLVNNAGILSDRLIVNMTEEEWDTVVDVDLKGHFVPLRHAGEYWRERSKAGHAVRASVINTSSTSGLFGNPGQANYGAAKAGIAALTIIAAAELGRYGVRVNAIAPAARTRLTQATPGLGDIVAPPGDGRFDEWDPANMSPLVAWLATQDCAASGQVFYAFGGTIAPMTGWSRTAGISRPDRWTIADINQEITPLL